MKLFATTSLLSMISAICHYGTSLAPRHSLNTRDLHFARYHGLEGALHWHALDPENYLCAVGKNQSPINIDNNITTIKGSSLRLRVDSSPDGALLEHLGSTIQVHLNGSAWFNNTRHSLVQFHFHTPSEHHLNGEYYPMEVHFVFQARDESIAVLGFLIEIAGASDFVSPSLSAATANIHEIANSGDITATAPLNFTDLLSRTLSSRVYTYAGSLTTPPCSEGINFNIVADPIFLEVSRFRAIKNVTKFNSRYTQNIPGQDNLLDIV